MTNSKLALREQVLVEAVIRHYSRLNSFQIYCEVAFLSKRIDIVLLDIAAQQYYAIETKVKWWKRVIEQARLNLLGADKVYVALPETKMHLLSRYENDLREYGIGLLSVAVDRKKSTIIEEIQAEPSLFKGFYYEKELRGALKDGMYYRSIT